MLAGRGQIVAVDGGTAEVAGITVASIGWNAPPEWAPGVDVVVCHTPPAGPLGLCRVSGHEFGDYGIYREIQARQPALLLCGHVHHPHHHAMRIGRTRALNPGCNLDAALPTFWSVNTDRRTAELRQSDQTLLAV